MAAASANAKFADRIIAQQVQLNRVEAGMRAKVRGVLINLREELVAKLRKMELEGVSRESFRRARAEKLLDQVRATIGEHYASMSNGLNGQLKHIANLRSEGVSRISKEVFGGSVMTTSLTPQDLRSIVKDLVVDGQPTKEWWKRQADGVRANYSREVRKGIAAGETTDDIVRRVRGRDTGVRQIVEIDGKKRILTKFTGGVIDMPTHQAETLVRTSVQAVSNDVLKETYKANSDVLNGEQLMATLDGDTCEQCMGLDGGVWDLETHEVVEGSAVEAPYPGDLPLHPRCRCVWVPAIKSWKQIIEEAGGKPPKKLTEVPEGTRASMDGQVNSKLTYDEWLHNQSRDVQIEALGPGKWELWKSGKVLNVGQLTDQTGNIMPVGELKKMFWRPRQEFEPGEELYFRYGEDPDGTQAAYMNKETGEWKSDRLELHDDIVELTIGDSVPAEGRPILHLLGGGSGSGKSSLEKSGLANVAEGSVHIDPDAVKTRLPEFWDLKKDGNIASAGFVHEESSSISKRITNEAAEGNRNILLDGTGNGKPAQLLKKMKVARDAGYYVKADYVTIPTDEAIRRADIRAISEPGRGAVNKDAMRYTHAAVSRVFPKMVKDGVFDEAKLWENSNGNTSGPRLIFEYKRGSEPIIHDQAAYDTFLAKGGEVPE